jgi:hypothetical protein
VSEILHDQEISMVVLKEKTCLTIGLDKYLKIWVYGENLKTSIFKTFKLDDLIQNVIYE